MHVPRAGLLSRNGVAPAQEPARHEREEALDEVQLPLGGYVTGHGTAHRGTKPATRHNCGKFTCLHVYLSACRACRAYT